jgi:hypothetical protein
MDLSTDITLLIILTSITVVGYLIAINSQGVARMSLSYLLATVLLAFNVFVVVQYANSSLNSKREVVYQGKIDAEKQKLENLVASQETKKAANKRADEIAKNEEAIKLIAFLEKSIKLSNDLRSVQLSNYALTYDQLVERANKRIREATALKRKFNALSSSLNYFSAESNNVRSGLAKLSKSAQYSKLYYSAEDGSQEEVREQVVRSNAAGAKTIFSQVKKSVGGQ